MTLSQEEYLKRLKQSATSLDLVDLQRKGVISKAGAWYTVDDFKKLPDYVWMHIKEVSGKRVKFYKDLDKSAAKLLELETGQKQKRPKAVGQSSGPTVLKAHERKVAASKARLTPAQKVKLKRDAPGLYELWFGAEEQT